MAVRDLLMQCDGVDADKILEVNVTESMSQAAVTAEVICTEHNLDIGDEVGLSIGYGDESETFSGMIVKERVWRRPEYNWALTLADPLVRAVDYFIASDDPDAPLEVSNIEASVLVGQLLALAGLTNYVGEETIFTYAVTQPYKINLTTVWQMVETISRVCGCVTYAQPDGQIRFATRKPYLVSGDASEFGFTVGNSGSIERISYLRSDEWLRNRVVVYGLNSAGVRASASAVSIYLPTNFYKTMVVAHELIDTNEEAQRTADVNLEMFNRLTETVSLQALGKPSVHARDIVAVTETFSGLSADEFVVFGVEHHVGRNGYSMDLTLTR